MIALKFYNRKKELELLETLHRNKPSFVVITGKRRVGKTELIKQFSKDKRSLYLFVDPDKSWNILLSEYEEYIKEVFGFVNTLKNYREHFIKYIGVVKLFSEIFTAFLEVLSTITSSWKSMRSNHLMRRLRN